MNYFEVKVRYSKENADGRLQKAADVYLIQTLTFSDAERIALDNVKTYARLGEEIEVTAIKKVQYQDLSLDDVGELADKGTAYYKAKVVFTEIDDTGKNDCKPSHCSCKTLM